MAYFKTVSFLFLTQYFFSLWWAAGDVMGKTYIFPFFSLSLSSLCVIYPYRGFSLSTATKTTKTYVLLSFIHCGIIKILKFNFLTQKLLSLSLCVVGPDDVKHTKNFSLSQSFFSLCVIYPRGRSSVHSSKRVTTGPNGLQRVPTG